MTYFERIATLPDADAGTPTVLRSLQRRYKLTEGDYAWALECAHGPGVESPVRVAIAELRKRGEAKC